MSRNLNIIVHIFHIYFILVLNSNCNIHWVFNFYVRWLLIIYKFHGHFLFSNYTAYVAFPLIDQLYTETTNFTSCFALCILLSVTLRFNKLLDQRWTLEQLEILLDNSKTEKSCQPSFYGNNGKVSLEFLLLFICPNYLMRQIMYSEV